jgi:hypothetical protein
MGCIKKIFDFVKSNVLDGTKYEVDVLYIMYTEVQEGD